jgi:hypothetical protein
MSKAERMIQWRHSRQLFDLEAEAGLATPSPTHPSGGSVGPHGTPATSASARHGTPYWTPLVRDGTSTRESPGIYTPPFTSTRIDTPPSTSATLVGNSDVAASLQRALTSATNEIDRLTRALETANALRDVAKSRVEEETAARLASEAREDTAARARAEAESAMLAARFSAKAHEEECIFLAGRAFAAETAADARFAAERRELAERWDEEMAAHELELSDTRKREEALEQAYDELLRVVEAERYRWAAERASLETTSEAAKSAWVAERFALLEALETDAEDRGDAKRDARVAEIIRAVATAVTAERAKALADLDRAKRSAEADAAAAEAVARAETRRGDALAATLAETRAALDAAEAARDAYEAAMTKAVREAALAESDARGGE